jgi:hypothetical protein
MSEPLIDAFVTLRTPGAPPPLVARAQALIYRAVIQVARRPGIAALRRSVARTHGGGFGDDESPVDPQVNHLANALLQNNIPDHMVADAQVEAYIQTSLTRRYLSKARKKVRPDVPITGDGDAGDRPGGTISEGALGGSVALGAPVGEPIETLLDPEPPGEWSGDRTLATLHRVRDEVLDPQLRASMNALKRADYRTHRARAWREAAAVAFEFVTFDVAIQREGEDPTDPLVLDRRYQAATSLRKGLLQACEGAEHVGRAIEGYLNRAGGTTGMARWELDEDHKLGLDLTPAERHGFRLRDSVLEEAAVSIARAAAAPADVRAAWRSLATAAYAGAQWAQVLYWEGIGEAFCKKAELASFSLPEADDSLWEGARTIRDRLADFATGDRGLTVLDAATRRV